MFVVIDVVVLVIRLFLVSMCAPVYALLGCGMWNREEGLLWSRWMQLWGEKRERLGVGLALECCEEFAQKV